MTLISRYTYSPFSHDVEEDIEPPWEESSASFSQIEPTDTSKLDAQALQEDGKDVRHQNDEEQSESVGRTSSHIRGIVSGINVCH